MVDRYDAASCHHADERDRPGAGRDHGLSGGSRQIDSTMAGQPACSGRIERGLDREWADGFDPGGSTTGRHLICGGHCGGSGDDD